MPVATARSPPERHMAKRVSAWASRSSGLFSGRPPAPQTMSVNVSNSFDVSQSALMWHTGAATGMAVIHSMVWVIILGKYSTGVRYGWSSMGS